MTRPAWNTRKERGSALLIRFMIWLSLRLGWLPGYLLLFPITLYFFCFSPGARASSRGYLGRVLGRAAGSWDVLRHIFTFACVLMERVFLLAARCESFRIEVEGLEHLTGVLGEGRGCLLFGAHLGSFEVLRAFGRGSPVPVKALMFRGNAGSYTRLMLALNSSLEDDIIEIGTPDAMLRVRDCLARGEIVGILADRSTEARKSVAVPFLGDPAPFPTGPAAMAAALGTPVVLFFGIRTGRRRYTVRFEAFADRIAADPAHRAADLRRWVERYADHLAEQCRKHPFNWFNFYSFWEPGPNAAPQPPARSAAADSSTTVARGGAAFVPR